MVEFEFIDMAWAVALTMAVTEIAKRGLESGFGGEVYRKLAPLVAVLAASVATAVLIDESTANMQEFALAVIVTAGVAMGLWSGPKNLAEVVMAQVRDRQQRHR